MVSCEKNERRHDFKHAFWMACSTGCNAVMGFVAGLILVRGLSQEEYGLVTSALAFFLVSQELVGRGINETAVRLGTKQAAGSNQRTEEVFMASLLLKMIISFFVVGTLSIWPQLITTPLGRPELKEAIPGIMASLVGFGLWSYVLTRHQAMFDFSRFAIMQPIVNFLKLTVFVLFFVFGTLSWIKIIWITALCFLVSALFLGIPQWINFFSHHWWTKRILDPLGEIWRYSRWNILAAVAFVSYTRMDIFVLTSQTTKIDVAIYNASWQMLSIIDLCTISIMTIMIPKVSHLTQCKEIVSWGRRCLSLSLAGAMLFLPLLFLADWFIPLLFGTSYLQSVQLFKVMYWGNILSLFIFPLIGILHAKKAFFMNSAIQIFLFVVSMPAYYWAIHLCGTNGVAMVTLFLRITNCTLLVAAIIFLLSRSADNKNGILRSCFY